MRRLQGQGDRTSDGLDWWMALVPAGACTLPSDFNKVSEAATPNWVKAEVPGTAAAALEAAGLWSREAPTPLDGHDVWYLSEIVETGRRSLVLGGMATIAEVYLDDRLLIATDDQFRRYEVDVDLTAGQILSVVFRALAPILRIRGPRARWRVPMIPEQGLRLQRAALLGRMPGWCPAVDIVGPTRGIALVERGPVSASDLDLTTDHDGKDGLLRIAVTLDGAEEAVLVCGGARFPLRRDGRRFSADLRLAGAQAWWPRSHGEPVLYPVSILAGGTGFDLGRIGFRRIERDPDASGFGLKVNGVPVFCRGAVWTGADLVGQAFDRATYAPWLRLAAEAGMNMVRVGGTMIPEARAFFDLCDEMGIMVWQDFPFANFDYPADDEAFVARIRAEAADILAEIRAAPSLAVLCGGSEVQQQAAMMGHPRERWPGPLFDLHLPEVASRHRPDVPYVANSPTGGPLPFVPNAGVAHYYGVGAYMRPLEDARRAEVTFAAECLAFANVPDAATLAAHLPVAAVHHPRWKERVPRDLGASWDFEDVRDHYLGTLFGVDPARLRREDPELYLDLSRATSAHVMETTFAEWRRGRSPTRGALVWTLMDLVPGAGWGVVDATGRPKSAWYALKRAFRPVQATLTDEGTNGLAIHLVNETAHPLQVEATLTCLKDGRSTVLSRSQRRELGPRSAEALSAFEMAGVFFDFSYAYRFGPPGHDVTVLTLTDAISGALLAEAFHHPLGPGHAFPRPSLSATVLREDGQPVLRLETDVHVPFLHVAVEGGRPSDDWFGLAPGRPKLLRLSSTGGGDGPVSGSVTTPGGRVRVDFAG